MVGFRGNRCGALPFWVLGELLSANSNLVIIDIRQFHSLFHADWLFFIA
jgi:hypothetical protein